MSALFGMALVLLSLYDTLNKVQAYHIRKKCPLAFLLVYVFFVLRSS